MNKKLVIWIIGSSGVGKTTLARNIHSFLAEMGGEKTELVKGNKEGVEFCYTRCSIWSANLGKLLPEVKCSGTDTLNTKEQITFAFQKAIEDGIPVVIVEGIMATSTWREFLKTEETILYTILLDTTEEVNFVRLRQRRAEKKDINIEDIILEDKTLENLRRKIKNFSNLFTKVGTESDYRTYFNTDNLSAEEISKKVIKELVLILTK